MNKFVRGVLASGALVAAMCTSIAVTPANAWYAYGGGGGVGVGVRVGVGYPGYYRGYGPRVAVAPYGVRVAYPRARVLYAPVVVVGPPLPAQPFAGHG